MQTTKSRFSVGDTIYVCYDGKLSRSLPATVTRVDHDGETWISFVPWLQETGSPPVACQLETDHGSLGCWVSGASEVGIMRSLGCRGDWYSVVPVETFIEFGYEIPTAQPASDQPTSRES